MRVLRFVYVMTCFTSGAALMVIELSGIRLLAPVFGNSIYTWTALIGVVLIAVSIGAHIGGVWADKTTSPTVVVWILAVSASFVIVVPSLHALSAQVASHIGLIYGPTLLSAVLFIVPGSLLGAINPYVTRLLAKMSNDRKIGAATGSASMASALGSFIGTFAAGYYLVPNLDVRNIFHLTALVLFVLALSVVRYADIRIERRQISICGAMLLVAITLSSSVKLAYGPGVLHVSHSRYQQVMVYEAEKPGGTLRTMINNGQPQGAIDIDTKESPYLFQRYWKLIEQYKSNIGSALMVGGGTFTVPQKIQDEYPDANVTVVEIDEVVTKVAQQYFDMDKYPEINVVISDARWFSNNDTERYDFIFVDAYNGSYSLPSHLATVEYFQTLKGRTEPDGLVMMNVIGNEDGPMSEVFLAIYKTFETVFGEVHVFKTPPESGNAATNLILMASASGTMPTRRYEVSPVVAEYMNTRIPSEAIAVASAPLLTDVRNPLDAIVSKMLMAIKR